MESLTRKVLQREQAAEKRNTSNRIAALARTSQIARSTLEVGGDDKYVEDAFEDAINAGDDARDTAEEAIEVSKDASDTADQARENQRVPETPTGLRVERNAGVWTPTGPEATIQLAWEAVGVGVDGKPIAGISYELFDYDASVAISAAGTATVQVPAGTIHSFRLRAVTAHGVPGDITDMVEVTAATPGVSDRKPAAPVLTSGFGIVVAHWDGTYTTPDTAGAHAVWVERFTGSGWVREGASLTASGTVAIPGGTVGEAMRVRLAAYDQLGRATGVSEEAAIEVVGVQRDDIDSMFDDFLTGIDERATQAQESASGANKIYRRTEDPTGEADKGDTWEKWSSLNASGKLLAFWRYEDTGWVQGALDETYLPLVNIGQGTYGELDGMRLRAMSVLADRLMVGPTENLILDPGGYSMPEFWSNSTYLAEGVGRAGGPGIVYPVTTSAVNCYNSTGATGSRPITQYGIPVEPGTKYRISAWYKGTVAGTTNATLIQGHFYDAAGQFITAAQVWVYGKVDTVEAWSQISTEREAPENARYLRFSISQFSSYPGQVTVCDPVVCAMTPGVLIEQGGIWASHLQVDDAMVTKLLQTPELWAGRVKVDFLEPNVGQKLNITANEAIEIIAGRQDEQDVAIQGAQETADAASGSAQEAADAAGTAQGAAQEAADLAASAEEIAKLVNDELEAHQSVFRVVPEGAVVATKDSSYELRLRPDSVALVQSGVPVSRWEGGRMIVAEAILQRAQLANHTIEPHGISRTIIRPRA